MSEPARISALEVLAQAGVGVRIDAGGGYTPTPVVSHAILTHNRGRSRGLADGIVVTPSHNPPEDGGFKYNPPHGGPADTQITDWIERRANALLADGCRDVRRKAYATLSGAANIELYDFVGPYVTDLAQAIDVDVIRASRLALGADPMGGAAVGYWSAIAERLRLPVSLVNDVVDPTFSFMPVDRDGKIRMDCSSPYAMAGLIGLKDATTSPSATTRTPTATASSRKAPGCSIPITTCAWRFPTCSSIGRIGARRPRSARHS